MPHMLYMYIIYHYDSLVGLFSPLWGNNNYYIEIIHKIADPCFCSPQAEHYHPLRKTTTKDIPAWKNKKSEKARYQILL